MSLVLSEVSKFGVAMAADSAVTWPNGRVYIGAQKLLPIQQINAGISMWGRGDIGGTDTDVWLQQYIENKIPIGISLWDMAQKLADDINNAFHGVIRERMGIHVGGYDEKNGIRGPAFYHIHNGHYRVGVIGGDIVEIPDEDPPIREFKANPDHTPDTPLVNGFFPIVSNGDFAIFSFMFRQIRPLLDQIQQATGFTFPFPESLSARGEYLRFWINTIIEIYRLSNARVRMLLQPPTAGNASIGGPVTVLTISDLGIRNFYTR